MKWFPSFGFQRASAKCRKRLMRTCRWRLQIGSREARRQSRRDKPQSRLQRILGRDRIRSDSA